MLQVDSITCDDMVRLLSTLLSPILTLQMLSLVMKCTFGTSLMRMCRLHCWSGFKGLVYCNSRPLSLITTIHLIVPIQLCYAKGPGGSSLFGLFTENGPFEVSPSGTIQKRSSEKFAWSDTYSMLFIDNPVGAGFSHTKTGSYCKDETCVGR